MEGSTFDRSPARWAGVARRSDADERSRQPRRPLSL